MWALSATVAGWGLPHVHASQLHLKCWGICDSRAERVNMVQIFFAGHFGRCRHGWKDTLKWILSLWCWTTHTVSQGAGFNSQMTQYMQNPIMVIHVQTCWVFFSFSCAFFFYEKLHEKIKSCNLNVVFQVALGV